MAILSGKIDISCSKASSEAMRNFSIQLLKEGYCLGQKCGKDEININDYLDITSEKKISQEIITQSNLELNKKIRILQNLKFSCLLCDAGTVLKSHCFHLILVNIQLPKLKILFDTFSGEKFDSNFYKDCFQKSFHKLKENNIQICTLISDSLPAQVRGFHEFSMEFDEPLYRIPCFSHMVNLVFLNIVKKSDYLHNFIYLIKDLIKFLRKKESVDFLKFKCPSYSPTRWLYIVDVLLFILDKRVDINNFIQVKNVKDDLEMPLISPEIEIAYKILVLLKLFSLISEKDTFQIYNLVPLIREFLEISSLILQSLGITSIVQLVISNWHSFLAGKPLISKLTDSS